MNATVRPFSFFPNIFIGLLSFLLAIPLFILAYHRLPDLDWPYHTDKILIFSLIAILLLLMVRSFKYVIITGVIAIVGWLWYGTVAGQYGFREFYQDGKAMIYGMQNNSNEKGVVFTGSRALSTDREIVKAIEYKNPVVRDFAVGATNEYFADEQQGERMRYRILIQCVAVFKKINENWNYVSDPQDDEYIAKASESVKLLAGDCDDHSILMSAAIKAIGGTTRLVYTHGHIYPELLIGSKKDLDHMDKLIHTKLFAKESNHKTIHYHKDEDGKIWLNLDYTAGYPGGKFMGKDVIECIYP
ncbi:MAG TPA: hypothetical protein VGQ09_15155 [Chitinophagaceae bacterium]|jgi:hypothetical protein|nr:hypothetical protein [Chitinophagaceae bacterium]